MSEKKTKMDRKLKTIEGSAKDIDWEKTAKEQAEQIRKMYEDRDKKALAAKEHLVSSLQITSYKYLTANGIMSALDTTRTVMGNNNDVYGNLAYAQRIAKQMSDIAMNMMDKAAATDPENMGDLCEGFYEEDMTEEEISTENLAKELMILNLCQNVGPDAQDVADFCKTADKEIEKARDALREFCGEHGLDFATICGEDEDCLYLSCRKDCGDGSKVIHDGELAHDICKDFESKSFE